jgi:hypothetical protein
MNYDFSPEFAEVHHDGESSENNRRYDWQDELEIKEDVDEIQVKEDQTYQLQGVMNDEEFAENIPNMTLFDVIKDNKSIAFMSCSKSIVQSHEIDKKEDQITLSVYLEEKEPLTNPVTGVYIALQDFPKFLAD